MLMKQKAGSFKRLIKLTHLSWIDEEKKREDIHYQHAVLKRDATYRYHRY